jgi:hypothetical protein
MASIIAVIGDRSAPVAGADRRGPLGSASGSRGRFLRFPGSHAPAHYPHPLSRGPPLPPPMTRSPRRLREPFRNQRRGDDLASGSHGAGMVALAEERRRRGDAARGGGEATRGSGATAAYGTREEGRRRGMQHLKAAPGRRCGDVARGGGEATGETRGCGTWAATTAYGNGEEGRRRGGCGTEEEGRRRDGQNVQRIDLNDFFSVYRTTLSLLRQT